MCLFAVSSTSASSSINSRQLKSECCSARLRTTLNSKSARIFLLLRVFQVLASHKSLHNEDEFCRRARCFEWDISRLNQWGNEKLPATRTAWNDIVWFYSLGDFAFTKFILRQRLVCVDLCVYFSPLISNQENEIEGTPTNNNYKPFALQLTECRFHKFARNLLKDLCESSS